ncbi:Cytochrome oxidase assembly protein ShyY1 [Modicisalibacter ilicicola DSM 19980]|uniref:SURF1-like protein n=1 Tax=Modicisalibacter ilicicola DSM 19980 TaxID=1121942 RepID=A0A1M4X7K8_9GAMM|nr:SURF1 family protein [Halomonas ilicicola]SHE89458.1 Cytochrome oxidase assembly protein ShyY1 [Halomonas ilicicola DSM 19980]
MGIFSSNKLADGVKKKSLWWLGWGLVIVLGLVLGGWQWQRAEEKRAYLARLEAAPTLTMPETTPPDGAEVRLAGRFLAAQTRFLDNRVRDGRVGVAVLTPLVDVHGRHWLIERGFVPSGPERKDPVVDTPTGRVELAGLWQSAGQDAPLFGPNQEGNRLQRIELSAWPEALTFAHDGWLHQREGEGRFASWWTPSVMPPSRHLGYAVQWWGLALAATAVMWLGRPRARLQSRIMETRS